MIEQSEAVNIDFVFTMMEIGNALLKRSKRTTISLGVCKWCYTFEKLDESGFFRGFSAECVDGVEEEGIYQSLTKM